MGESRDRQSPVRGIILHEGFLLGRTPQQITAFIPRCVGILHLQMFFLFFSTLAMLLALAAPF